MTIPRMRRATLFAVLDVAKPLLAMVLLIMFINIYTNIASQAEQTKHLSENTNQIVKSQAAILAAIKRASTDSNLSEEQRSKLTICMLKVPQDVRTDNFEKQCRSQAMASSVSSTSGTGRNLTGNLNPSSSQSTPNKNTQQSNTSPKSDSTPAPTACTGSTTLLFLTIQLNCKQAIS